MKKLLGQRLDKLYADIMNIRCNAPPEIRGLALTYAYGEGHRAARHAAAGLITAVTTELLAEVSALRLALEEATAIRHDH